MSKGFAETGPSQGSSIGSRLERLTDRISSMLLTGWFP